MRSNKNQLGVHRSDVLDAMYIGMKDGSHRFLKVNQSA